MCFVHYGLSDQEGLDADKADPVDLRICPCRCCNRLVLKTNKGKQFPLFLSIYPWSKMKDIWMKGNDNMTKILFQGDDFGFTRGVTLGIVDSIDRGVLRNTGLFANMPSA
ncbi:MAG: ChbG/HpnK family deacetylase, partial [Erysipelotrichaceae bacterium]|nr:ChbG/HpnK family deacetylase [Erysipelotrichaceae bacterium]